MFSFDSLWETLQTLIWAIFGLIDLDHLALKEKHGYTEFVGRLMFGTYSVISIIVLLNMLIAMMSNSYQLISVRYFGTLLSLRTRRTFGRFIFQPFRNTVIRFQP